VLLSHVVLQQTLDRRTVLANRALVGFLASVGALVPYQVRAPRKPFAAVFARHPARAFLRLPTAALALRSTQQG